MSRGAFSVSVVGFIAVISAFLIAAAPQIMDSNLASDPGLEDGVNKFGFTTNADSADPTDIWDRANPTNDVAIWLAPTAARIHAIDSTSASDDGDPGAGVVRVYGLQDWDSKETSEDVTLNGTDAVNTVNSYVIIHRMKILSGVGVNVGYITALAAVDGTYTAQINPGDGQTQMAVYGIPSTQYLKVTSVYAGGLRASPSGFHADIDLLWCYDVENQPANFQTKFHGGLDQEGNTHFQHTYSPYVRLNGPGILKVQVTSSNDDAFVQGGFDLVLRDQ